MIHISLSSKDWYKQGNSEALKRSTPGRCSKDLVHIYLDSEVTERKEKYLARGNDVGQIKYVLLEIDHISGKHATCRSYFFFCSIPSY